MYAPHRITASRCASVQVSSTTRTGRSVHHAITTVGLDLAKNVLQVHGVNRHGKVGRQLKRDQVAGFFANLPACLIGMEACSGAHHWARKLQAMSHTVRLMAPRS